MVIEDLFAAAVQCQQCGRSNEAEALYRRVLAIDPCHVDGLHQLGVIAAQSGRHAVAADLIGKAVALSPDLALAHHNLGKALRALGRCEAAIAAYRSALALREGYVEAHVSLAIAQLEFGYLAEAAGSVERALAIDPSCVRAWFVRSHLKTFARDDPDFAAMAALLSGVNERGLSPEDRVDLEFALGKAWMDVGDADQAFARLNAGNRRVRGSLVYDVEADVSCFKAIADAFTSDVMNLFAGAGDTSEHPVFVVGMPRSGTTLVEQILASHPDVHGAGELNLLSEVSGGALFPTLGRELPAWGRAYAERLAALAPGKRRVVDKMPSNFQFLGLIQLMLPNARIIHCRRDPIDTCLSCYSRKFADRQDFSYDLRDLGRYYRAYEDLMDHWRRLLPHDRLLEVRYEDLVNDLRTEAERLVAFCGLEWNEACLDFHRTDRPVQTASVNQVRQPIYRSSVSRWKQYARHLEPLLGALGAHCGRVSVSARPPASTDRAVV